MHAIGSMCCGWHRRVVPVVRDPDDLAIEICDLCAERQWFLNGAAVSSGVAVHLAVALDALAA